MKNCSPDLESCPSAKTNLKRDFYMEFSSSDVSLGPYVLVTTGFRNGKCAYPRQLLRIYVLHALLIDLLCVDWRTSRLDSLGQVTIRSFKQKNLDEIQNENYLKISLHTFFARCTVF